MLQSSALLLPIIPPKVQAAQAFLYYTKAITSPENGISRDLDHSEEEAYNSAIEVLRLYFSGECEFSPTCQPIGCSMDEIPEDEIPEHVGA